MASIGKQIVMPGISKSKKNIVNNDNCGVRTHASEETRTLT